jgi:hypothetical protein
MEKIGKRMHAGRGQVNALRKYRWLVFIMMVIMLTGCVSGTATIEIHKNGSADANIRFALEQQTKKYLANMDPFVSMQSILKNNGFQVREFDGKNDFGFEAMRHYDSLEEFQTAGMPEAQPVSSGSKGNNIVSVTYDTKKQLFFTIYNIKSTIDFAPLYDDFLRSFSRNFSTADVTSGFIGHELRKQMNLKVDVALPVQATKSNATKKEKGGKQLQWKIDPTKVNTLTMQVKVPNVRNVLIAGGAAVLFLVIAVIIWWKVRKKKKETNNKA